MRTKETMKQLILDVAKNDRRVRGIILNGSRANPNAVQDNYMDFDVVYYVDDFESFPKDNKWIDVFGKRFLMQTSKDFVFAVDKRKNVYVWLMLFEDGNRIDLTVKDVSEMIEDTASESDGLAELWLDKDNRIERMPNATESQYFVKRPTRALYNSCMNEFYWIVPSVVKSLKRDELPSAWFYVNILRHCLEGMIDWYFGDLHDYAISTGKFKKNYRRLLDKDAYTKYLETFFDASAKASFIKGLPLIFDLFQWYALRVAKIHGYKFDEETHQKVMEYVKKHL